MWSYHICDLHCMISRLVWSHHSFWSNHQASFTKWKDWCQGTCYHKLTTLCPTAGTYKATQVSNDETWLLIWSHQPGYILSNFVKLRSVMNWSSRSQCYDVIISWYDHIMIWSHYPGYIMSNFVKLSSVMNWSSRS